MAIADVVRNFTGHPAVIAGADAVCSRKSRGVPFWFGNWERKWLSILWSGIKPNFVFTWFLDEVICDGGEDRFRVYTDSFRMMKFLWLNGGRVPLEWDSLISMHAKEICKNCARVLKTSSAIMVGIKLRNTRWTVIRKKGGRTYAVYFTDKPPYQDHWQ